MALLEIKDIHKSFGGITALAGFNLAIEQGETSGLIGPNGSGKTTLFNVVTGFLRQNRGEIIFDGESIDQLPPYDRTRKGLVRTFQLTNIFKGMSAYDNILVGMHLKTKVGLRHIFLFNASKKREEKMCRERAEELLDFFELSDRKYEKAGALPPKDQRMIEIARALAAEPRVLMLDEPFGGLNPSECINLMTKLVNLSKNGLTVFLIEHNMKMIMEMCNQIAVLNFGEKIAEGRPEDIKTNANVIKAYLGSEA